MLPGSQTASDKLMRQRAAGRLGFEAGPTQEKSVRGAGQQGVRGQAHPDAGSCARTLFSSQAQATPIPLSSGPTGGSDCPAKPGPLILGHFTHCGFSQHPACQSSRVWVLRQETNFPMAFSASSEMKITTLSHVAAWGTNRETP